MYNAIEAYNEIITNGLTPCFEVEESVVYFEPVNETTWQWGTVTNTGILQPTIFNYDIDFSIDENLQAMLEDIESESSYVQ